jgi:hypothetical protein
MKKEEILKYFNVELTDSWKDGLDWYIYLAETANSHDVHCSTQDPERIHVDYDVYLDDENIDKYLEESFKEAILLHSNAYYEGDIMEIYIYSLKEPWVNKAIESLIEDIHDIEMKKEEDEREWEEHIYGKDI